MAQRFTIEAVFRMIDRVTAPINRIQNRMGRFTRRASAGILRLNSAVIRLTSSLRSMAVIGGGAAVSIGFVLKDLITVGADFGRAIGVAAATFSRDIQRGDSVFNSLIAKAREVGSTTEFTSIQAANALKFLALAGFNTVNAIAAVPDVVNFATAAQIDLATAADIASDALFIFGLNSKDPIENLKGLNRVMDTMVFTASSTNTTVSQLFESMKKGGPISDTAGMSIESYAASMGFVASSGIKAATSGIAAKNIILALAGVGNKAATIFKRLGISLVDLKTGNLRDQLDVLDDLRDNLADRPTGEQVEIISGIFGKIPIASAARFVSEAGKAVRGFRLEIEKLATGTSKRMAEFIRGDVRGSIDALFSSIDDVKIGIMELNKGPFKDMLDGWTKLIRLHGDVIALKIGKFLLKIINNFDTIVMWLKNIAIGLGAFIIFTTVLRTFVLVMTTVSILTALIGGPFALVVIIVLALVAAFTALIVWSEDIGKAFTELPSPLRLMLVPLEAIVEKVKFLKNLGKVQLEIVGIANDNVQEAIIPFVDAIGGFFTSIPSPAELADIIRGDNTSEVQPQVINPQERITRSIEENKNTSELLVRADSGSTVDVVKNGIGSGLKVQQSGSF